MAGKLRRQFYNASSPECRSELRTGIYKPSAAFEVHNQISGIARYYKFPGGLSPADYENSISFGRDVFACYENPIKADGAVRQIAEPDPALMQLMQNEWEQLKALNPPLNRVKIDTGNPLMLFHAIEGTACLFNPDDISFFIRNMKEGGSMAAYRDAMAKPSYSKLYNAAAEKAVNHRMGWVPAPPTLRRISKKLDEAASTLDPA